MGITQQQIDQLRSQLGDSFAGRPDDYLAVAFLASEFGLDRDEAATHVAFEGGDHGIDAFHFHEHRRNLYLFQFKWTTDHSVFKESIRRLTETGMDRVFGLQDGSIEQDEFLLQLSSCLTENVNIIDRIYLRFVFRGDPEQAEQSCTLDKLKEDLENKKFLIDRYFGRTDVNLVIDFVTAGSRKVGARSHLTKTHEFQLRMGSPLTLDGPNGEILTIGFANLVDLYRMYGVMGQRFFERNIRGALPEDKAVNRSLTNTLRRIVLEEKQSPRSFSFHHNGVAMNAESLMSEDGHFLVTEPRLLNGAQTVSTLARFIDSYSGDARYLRGRDRLDQLQVLCRITTEAGQQFVTSVTISNNRQNPVNPWNLRANDEIQLELQDKFRDDVQLYYERQENAFKNLSEEELEEYGVTDRRRLDIRTLAMMFLASDGNVDKMRNLRESFEDDGIYSKIFNKSRLKADTRLIVLCFKINFRLRRLLRDIVETGPNKYEFVYRAKNLLWALLIQAVLNDEHLDYYAHAFGDTLSVDSDYQEWLSGLARNRCRHLLRDLVEDQVYLDKLQNNSFAFLRTNAAFKFCLESGRQRFGWTEKHLG